jgi:hypothetical protein
MVLRRGLADTFEVLGADANLGQAAIVAEFGMDMAIVRRSHHPKDLGGRHGVARIARHGDW